MNEAKLLDKLRTLTERIERLEAESIRRRASIPTVIQGLLTENINVSAGDWDEFESVPGKVRLFERNSTTSGGNTLYKRTDYEVDVQLCPPADYERGVWVYAIRDADGLYIGTAAGCDPTATGSPPALPTS